LDAVGMFVHDDVALAPLLRPDEDWRGGAVRAPYLPRATGSHEVPSARCRRALRSFRSSKSSLTHRRSVPWFGGGRQSPDPLLLLVRAHVAKKVSSSPGAALR
jgi:hypothetical protein